MMHILCSTDKNYIMPTGVMMKSVCVNNYDDEVCFHVIVDKSVTWWHKYQLRSVLKNNRKHTIEFHTFNDSWLDTYPRIGENRDKTTKATYYRLFVTKILPADIHKVIYLDGDIVVTDSIKKLWNKDISDYAIAAVTDMSEKIHDYSRLGYDPELGYFNAGAIVINVKYWREHNVIEDFMDIIQYHPNKIKVYDQDVLNIVFCRNKLCLPLEYNLQNGFLYKPELMELDYAKYKDAISYAINHYVIIHYSCFLKPWFADCDNPLHTEWLKYFAMTRWRNRKLPRMYPLSLRVRVGNVLRRLHLLHPIQEEVRESLQYINLHQ